MRLKRFVVSSIIHGYTILVDFPNDEDQNYEVTFENMWDAINFVNRGVRAFA